MLTDRQQSIFNYILRFRHLHGCSPSIPEIQREFGIRSPNGVAGHLRALESKGMIQRAARGSRQIDVAAARVETAEIPLVSSIPAGHPTEYGSGAAERTLAIDSATLGFEPPAGCYALRVQGDSMINAGILPGDCVVIDPTATPRNNQIVAALIDGESTLKRLIQVNGRWFLKAENPAYRDLYPRTGLEVQGVVRTLVRQLPQ